MKHLIIFILTVLFSFPAGFGQNLERKSDNPPCIGFVDVTGSKQPVPVVIFHPGPEYGAAYQNFGIAPSIARTPGGRLYCGFTSGGVGEGTDNFGVVVTSDDDGVTWSSPYIVFDTDKEGPIRNDHVTVWTTPSGELWIMWSQYPDKLRGNHSSLWVITSSNPDDDDPQWSSPRKIADEQHLLTTPTVLSDGTWIFPTGNWNRVREGHPSRPLISNDNGLSFEMGGPLISPVKNDYDEYMIVEKSDGHLIILSRHKGSFIQYESADKGRSWTPMGTNGLPHTNARFVFMKLRSGNWLLVKHGTPDPELEKAADRGRTDMTAYISHDQGLTWEGGLMLEERNAAYPFGYQDPDGTIYVVYDRERFNQPEILMARFTEEDVMNGKPISGRAAFKLLVNKGEGSLSAILPNQNADGVAFSRSKTAVIKPLTGEIRPLVIGDTVFSNRTSIFVAPPKELEGKNFVFSEYETTKATCVKPGMVYVLTPGPNRNESESLENELLEKGFVKTDLPESGLISHVQNTLCSLYQKRVKKGEVIGFGQWGVLVF